MFSHVHVGITDFERSFAFYKGLMDELGFTLKFSEPENLWLGEPGCGPAAFSYWPSIQWQKRHTGEWSDDGVARPQPDAVDRCYARAMASGAQNEGKPGLRPHYHPNYYGAYFCDPDGNKLCVCCHGPAGG
jgi:catechol 2,3-dioxygenase-like lactoylglutathione lyase family enzyme